MLANDTITFDKALKKPINAQLEDGLFDSPTEVVKAGIALLEERQRKIEFLKKAIKVGHDSGYTEFDFEAFNKKMHKKHIVTNA